MDHVAADDVSKAYEFFYKRKLLQGNETTARHFAVWCGLPIHPAIRNAFSLNTARYYHFPVSNACAKRIRGLAGEYAATVFEIIDLKYRSKLGRLRFKLTMASWQCALFATALLAFAVGPAIRRVKCWITVK